MKSRFLWPYRRVRWLSCVENNSAKVSLYQPRSLLRYLDLHTRADCCVVGDGFALPELRKYLVQILGGSKAAFFWYFPWSESEKVRVNIPQSSFCVMIALALTWCFLSFRLYMDRFQNAILGLLLISNSFCRSIKANIAVRICSPFYMVEKRF